MSPIRSAAPVILLLGGVVIVAGLVLRLHGITGQILMDDEWHSLFYVADFSLGELFTHMGSGATCVPLNVFQKLALETVGWSEMVLRMPSIVSGMLCLLLFPLLIRKQFNDRITLIFTMLLAISPHLVFASSFSRPYGPYLLLSFLSILGFQRWVISGRTGWAVVYVLSGGLAVWVHLFALVAVAAPPLWVLLRPLLDGVVTANGRGQVAVRASRVGLILALSMGLGAVLLLPALVNSSSVFFADRPRSDVPTALSFAEFLGLLAGTSNVPVVILLVLLWIGGAVVLFRTNALLAEIFGSVILGYLVAIMVMAPPKMDVAIQIARYCIPLFPIAFVGVAVGFDRGLTFLEGEAGKWFRLRVRGASYAIILGAGVALFLAGPLRRTHAGVNNFMNHAAYQESHQPLRWEHPYHSRMFNFHMTVGRETMPGFYRTLERMDPGVAVVEYPVIIGFHLNVTYYYQHFHQKRVIAGYVSDLDLRGARKAGDAAHANMTFDFPMSNLGSPSQTGFRNMVDVKRKDALAASGAKYLIVHRNLMKEQMANTSLDQVYLPAVDVEKTGRREFGEPVFADAWITVFEIPSRGP